MRTSRNENNNEETTTNLTSRLSQSELVDLRQAFDMFDTEMKGVVSTQNLREVLEEMKTEEDQNAVHNSNVSNLARLNRKLSSHSPQKLTFEDFVNLVVEPDPSDTRSDVQKVFDLFDKRGKGYIDIDDLRAVSVDLGENMSDEELKDMIQRISLTSKVSADDFGKMLEKNLFS